MMKIITLSSLYPSRSQPGNGVFIENRTAQLAKTGAVDNRIVAPVPWFPYRSDRFGRYGKMAQTPHHEVRSGVKVTYPRYLVIPKMGMALSPYIMARAILPTFRKIAAAGHNFQAIDAYYFYPDGVAATLIGKWLRKPVVINGLGSDVNVFPKFPLPRKWIIWAAERASAVTTVSEALKSELLQLGVAEKKVQVNRHGVDHTLFCPEFRKDGGPAESNRYDRTLLCVGNLLEAKGQHLIIDSLRQLPNMNLILVGQGEDEAMLRRQVESLRLDDRVRFSGHVEQHKLPSYYNRADAFVLPSRREGIPNVILESMACGTPVIATRVGGIPEVMQSKHAGRLMHERSVAAIVSAVNDLFHDYPSTEQVFQHSNKFQWSNTSATQLNILNTAAAR